MLRLNLLGSFSLNSDNYSSFRNKKAQALLGFLALNLGQDHSRERIATLLWSESDANAARQSLRQCLRALRSEIPELPLSVDHDVIRLDGKSLAIDVVEFQRAVSDPSPENLKIAADLYKGHFLEGLNARSELFEEWLLSERGRLRAAAISALHNLLSYMETTHARQEAISLALRLLAIDPLQEEVDRTLMRLYAAEGQTALALRQFKRCEAILKKELNVEPDGETKALYQSLLRNRGRSRVANAPAMTIQSVDVSETQFNQTIEYCTAPDGVRIAYAQNGSGPPLVKTANWLNHLEFDFVSPVWRHWIEALSADHLLLRYDERGNGLSDWDAYDVSFDAFVSDLETVIDAAGLKRFALLGISQGCAISIAYAIKYPEKVSHLILYGGYAKGWSHSQDPAELARRQALATLVREGWGQENPIFRQIFTSLFIPGATSQQMQWFNDLQKMTTSPENAYRLALEFGKIDIRPMLDKVSVPTLVMHARDDARVSFREGQELASRIPKAKFIPLESKNHLLLGDEPAWKVFLDSVQEFLKQ